MAKALVKKVWDAVRKKWVYEYQKRASDKKVRKELLKKKKAEGKAAMKKVEDARKAEAAEEAAAGRKRYRNKEHEYQEDRDITAKKLRENRKERLTPLTGELGFEKGGAVERSQGLLGGRQGKAEDATEAQIKQRRKKYEGTYNKRRREEARARGPLGRAGRARPLTKKEKLYLRSGKERSGLLNKGGAVHRMPDGTLMKGAKHGMKHGGSVKGKCKVDGIAIRGRTRAKHK